MKKIIFHVVFQVIVLAFIFATLYGYEIPPANEFVYPVENDYHISQDFNTPPSEGFCSGSGNKCNTYYTQKDCNQNGCQWYYGHTGLDLSNRQSGGIVSAITWGKVIHTSENCNNSDLSKNVGEGGWGCMIRLEHRLVDGKIFRSQYGHLQKIVVSYGQSVTLGQKIGEVGNTGFSTSPHLHFEIKDPDTNGYGYVSSGANISDYYHPYDFIALHKNDAPPFSYSNYNPTDYEDLFNEYYSHMSSILGIPVGTPAHWLNKKKYPGVIAMEYKDGGSALTHAASNGIAYEGYGILILDLISGNDYFPILIHSGFLAEFLDGNGKCGAPITPEYDNSYNHSHTESRQEFKNNCYYYWKQGQSISINQDEGYYSPGMGKNEWIGTVGDADKVSSQIARSYFMYSDARNELGSPGVVNIYGYNHSAYVHNMFPNEEWKKKLGIYGQPYVFMGPGYESFIIYNPSATGLTKAFVIKGEIFRIYAHELGFADGPLGLPAANQHMEDKNTRTVQEFQGGRIFLKSGSTLAATYEGCIFYKDGKNYWAENSNVCNQGIDTPEGGNPCLPDHIIPEGQLLRWYDVDGYMPPYFYVWFSEKAVYLTSGPMVEAWGGESKADAVPRCMIDSQPLYTVTDYKQASFPEKTVVHHNPSGKIFILENGAWRWFWTWETYVYYINYEGISSNPIHIGDYEFSFFPEGDWKTMPACVTFPLLDDPSLIQWMSNDGSQKKEWYFLYSNGKLIFLTSPSMLDAWKRVIGGEPQPMRECLISLVETTNIMQLPNYSYPEGTVVQKVSNGRIYIKNNNQWHWFTDWDTYIYFIQTHGIMSYWIYITDEDFNRIQEGISWSKPGGCWLTIYLSHGTLVRKQGDDGALWPYIYVMYYGQLVYTATDPMYQSYGSLESAIPVNYCIIDSMNPIHVNDIPLASFNEGAVVHHVPTGRIFIKKSGYWHLFPTWNDYVYFQNEKGVKNYWINIGDYEFSMLPVGNPWIQPTSTTSLAMASMNLDTAINDDNKQQEASDSIFQSSDHSCGIVLTQKTFQEEYYTFFCMLLLLGQFFIIRISRS